MKNVCSINKNFCSYLIHTIIYINTSHNDTQYTEYEYNSDKMLDDMSFDCGKAHSTDLILAKEGMEFEV